MTTRLLMLCLGNICRSPMAEGAMRARLAEAGISHVEVDSAGTGNWHVGQPPDRRSIACAQRNGVDISGLRGRQLQPADFAHFDWILCADASNLRDARAMCPPQASARLALLLPWASGGGGQSGDSVPDPYTGTRADFDRVWSMVDEAARSAIASRSWQRAE